MPDPLLEQQLDSWGTQGRHGAFEASSRPGAILYPTADLQTASDSDGAGGQKGICRELMRRLGHAVRDQPKRAHPAIQVPVVQSTRD